MNSATLKKGVKSEKKKLKKEMNLYDSAYELFETKGINDTSIDDIVKKAGVAKGTFYLYFTSKYDIIDRIILKKSSAVIKQAVQSTLAREYENFGDEIIYFIDYVIEYFRENKRLLRIIHKNLSWGLFRKALANPEQNAEMNEIKNFFAELIGKGNIVKDDFEKNLFMVIELTGAVCYSSIILQEPDNIDAMKPVLFRTIRKMLSF